MKIFTCILMLVVSLGFGQSTIEGYIIDRSNDQPLPYATIKILSSDAKYTITNQDGKFLINGNFAIDSLEVSYIGFETKKIAVSYFETNANLYVSPQISELDEVVLVSNSKDYAYNLLGRLIGEYRKKKEVTKSKAFLTLTSSARNIPIELVEGFFNSEQSLSNGVIDLNVKSGRFGQNKSFPFYNLDNTKILSDFQFFKSSHQILPSYPGNMAPNAIKRNYNLKFDECNTCSKGDVSISFIPKKENGRLFHGKVLFNSGQLVIKKIELGIRKPLMNALSSINKDIAITFHEIQLNIVFNPSDLDKIQYVDFSFKMNYYTNRISETIDSHSFLYFYDYDTSFEEPYFTKTISFNNDYDKMIALKASDDFWITNYQFPTSVNEKNSMDFMRKNGYLINYDSSISSENSKYTKTSVLSWSRNKRIIWEDLKQSMTTADTKNTPRRSTLDNDANVDKSSQSISAIKKIDPNKGCNNNLNISYMLDTYKKENGAQQNYGRTLLDIGSSCFNSNRTVIKLVYFNIIFDLYETYRQNAESQVTDEMTFEEVKALFNKAYKEASSAVKKMKRETNHGASYKDLKIWNNNINSKLNIDNFALVH